MSVSVRICLFFLDRSKFRQEVLGLAGFVQIPEPFNARLLFAGFLISVGVLFLHDLVSFGKDCPCF